MSVCLAQRTEISIHALVKRATRDNPEELARLIISIHALVKRATKRAPEMDKYYVISIHALVKRATKFINYRLYAVQFQSTPS